MELDFIIGFGIVFLIPVVFYALARRDLRSLREQASSLKYLAESEQLAHAACHKRPEACHYPRPKKPKKRKRK